MPHLPLLPDLLLLLGAGVGIALVLQRFKLPTVLGFLLTGVCIGPGGLGWFHSTAAIAPISELGVMLLLFVIGMELSISQLVRIRKTVFLGGALQVGLTLLATAGISALVGLSWPEAVFMGCLFSLSSTAVVLKMLQDRNEMTSTHGRNALGILIFQDLIVVPMMLAVPFLAGDGGPWMPALSGLLLKSSGALALTYLGGRFLVPWMFHRIARTHSKELFLLGTVLVCLAFSALTEAAGLSLALGAFLAGLVISDSVYSHQATSVVLPFRELFSSIFFISIGMMLDVSFVWEHLGSILLLVVGVLLAKSAITAFAMRLLRYPPVAAWLTGLALFQVGEFAFVLSQVGMVHGLLQTETHQTFLAVSILSLMLTPVLFLRAGSITQQMLPQTGNQTHPDSTPSSTPESGLENHLIIIGFGLNGTHLAQAARAQSIPFAVLETDPDLVQKNRALGLPIHFGDGTDIQVLQGLKPEKAQAVVIAISQPESTRTIIRNIRQLAPSVYVIVRTRYVREMQELIALGADEVVPEEFETAVEIFSRVLGHYMVPLDRIDQFASQVRADNYALWQSTQMTSFGRRNTHKPQTDEVLPFPIACVRVYADSGPLLHRSLAQSQLRKEHGIQVVAIQRSGNWLAPLTPDETLQQGDVLYVHGESAALHRFHRLLNG